MQNLIFTTNVVVPYFLLMMVGYMIRLVKKEEVAFVPFATRFVFKIAMPCKLFYNAYRFDISGAINVKMFVFTGVTLVAVALLAMLVYHFIVDDNKVRGALVQVTFRCNFMIFATAIAEAAYGDTGLIIAAALTVLVVPLLNVLAVMILEIYGKSGDTKSNARDGLLHILLNPLIIGITLGFLANVSGLLLPTFCVSAIASVAACTNPLAFIILGMQFSFERFKSNGKLVAIGTFARLVAVPLFCLPIAVLLGFRNEVLIVLFAVFGTPVAVSSYIMAAESGVDSELAGQLVVSTTFFGMFTMFVFLFALRSMGLL